MWDSLHGRLVLLVSGCLVLVWLLFGIWVHDTVRDDVGELLDERLASSARMVASMMGSGEDLHVQPQHYIEQRAMQGVSCQVSNLQGQILLKSEGAPSSQLAAEQDGFAVTTRGGDRWRTFTLTWEGIRVVTAEPMAVRTKLLNQLVLVFTAALVVTLLVLLLAVRQAVNWALRPLESLRQALENRAPACREPVVVEPRLRELVPLEQTLNEWLAETCAALERERTLTDNLAHELRTPLSALRTQLQVARWELPEPVPALDAAEQACVRMADNLSQLLALARLDQAPQQAPLSAEQIIQRSAALLSGQWQQRGVSWKMEGDLAALLPVSPALAEMALRNLLENALRFSPVAGEIRIGVEESADAVTVTVRDQGPGLAGQTPEQVKRRGARGDQGQTGLGLAIVSTIMARSGGRLLLEEAEQGGLQASLYWPKVDHQGNV